MFLLDIVTKDIIIEEFTPISFPIVLPEISVPVLLRETCIWAELHCRNITKRSQTPNRQERLKLIHQLSKKQSNCSHTPHPQTP